MFYLLAKVFFKLYFTLYHRLEVDGLDALTQKRPVILAANHASYLDPPLVGSIFPDRLRFIAWEGLFVPIFGALIGALGAVPVSQANKGSAAALLRQVMGFLESGSSVLIFPEGERTFDGNLLPIEPGFALLAFKTGAPVVPVWIEGTFRAMSRHVTFPRPRKIHVTFLPAIDPLDRTLFPDEMSEKDKRTLLVRKLEEAY